MTTQKEEKKDEVKNENNIKNLEQVEENYQKYMDLSAKYRDLAQQCLGAIQVLKSQGSSDA